MQDCCEQSCKGCNTGGNGEAVARANKAVWASRDAALVEELQSNFAVDETRRAQIANFASLKATRQASSAHLAFGEQFERATIAMAVSEISVYDARRAHRAAGLAMESAMVATAANKEADRLEQAAQQKAVKANAVAREANDLAKRAGQNRN